MAQLVNDPKARMITGDITPLKYYLIERKMTVQDLADRTGLNKRNLESYVSGRKDIHNIALISGLLIAKALEVSTWDLFPKVYDNTADN